ncbi:MAG: hypothetical protein P1U56_18470 [Saprospiraceae bacterium]|nr:hypothetical protein [Saprospiraceae bacterium]
MRHKRIHRITALILAFMMLFSSVGFSVDFHYCKGNLKSFSLIGEASACHQAKKICPRHAEMQVEEKSDDSKCCTNETIVVEDLDTDYNVSPDIKLTDFQVDFIASFVLTLNGVSLPKIVKSTFLENQVNLPSRDIYVLLERFLI